MSQSANVRSVEAIHDFKVALANFAEDARNALGSSEMEIRRTRDWLQRDQLSYWMSQIKHCNEKVSMARTELFRRKISQQGSDAVSDTEQKENLKLAQRRLEEAEDKVKIIKKWIPVFDHAIAEYHATSQPLGDRLSGTLVNSMTLLERMITSLEAYIATAPPTTPIIPPTSTAATPGSVASTPASAATVTATETETEASTGAEPGEETVPAEESTEPGGGPRP
jgi:hypothetical protein